MKSCCSCWGGSQIEEENESPRSIAETLACAAASGLLPKQKENLGQYRNKIPADPLKDRAPQELIPSPVPTLEPTARKAEAGTTGSDVSVVADIGSPVARPVDSPPLDLEPPSSPRLSDHEPSLLRTSSAHEHDRGIEESSEPVSVPIETSASTSREISVSDHDHERGIEESLEPVTVPIERSAWTSAEINFIPHDDHDLGIEESSEPVSVPIERFDSTSREISVTVPETSSAPHSEAPSPKPSPAESTVDSSTSKLAIPCTCNKGKRKAREQVGSQKPKVEPKMSRGGRRVPRGMGSGRGNEPSMQDDGDVVGLRAPRRGYIASGNHQRRAYEMTSPARSRSPVRNPYGDDNDDDTLAAFVSNDPSAFQNLYPTPAPLGRAAIAAPRRVPVQARPPRGRTRGRPPGPGRGRVHAPQASSALEATALGNEYWQLERRRREVVSEARQKTLSDSRQRGPQVQDAAAADGFQPEQGDLLVRHRKWPGEPMIEFYEVERHIIREHDQLLRQSLQYNQRADSMLCRASLRRATLVDAVDSQGNGGQEIRWDDVGSSQITFNSFVQLRPLNNRYIFGRRFEPRSR